MPSARSRIALLIALAVFASALVSRGRTAAPPAKSIAPFTLPDAAGGKWALPDAKEARAVVVVFTGTACPINTAFMPTLAKLHKEFGSKGVAFVAVNANAQDDPAHAAAHAKKHGLPFPVLKDAGAAVADRFGAEHTPEAFLLDETRVVRYHGRIDDQFGFDYKRPAPTRRDLAIAIEEVLASKTVSVPTTAVEGCIIGRPAAPKNGATVTYSKEVSRILQDRCQECHRPGQVGPMALMNYADAAAWAPTIKMVLRQGRMPPWHADPAHGTFLNDRRLADTDKKALLDWIEQGCPEGNPKDVPVPKTFADGWTIGTPDVVFKLPRPVNVPAEMPRRGIAYQYFEVPTNFDRDMWVQAAEARPGAREVVHHIVVLVIDPTKGRERSEDRVGNGHLVGYAPGDMPSVYAPGQAKKIPKGSKLYFQMHYTPDGTARTDQSSVGLIFAKDPPKVEVKTRGVMNPRFAIPAGADNHEVKSESVFRQDVELLNLMPHMHLRGKDFKYEVLYPDGRREILLSVPRYDFNWQSLYRFKDPIRLPAGSKVECTAHFDNSSGNKNNPDPGKDVHWGDQTWEEMMIGYVDYAVMPAR